MKIQHLDKLALVHIDFDIWSGQTSLKKEDLKIDPKEMNMDKVIQLGSKKVCDPEKLKVFSTLKTEARRSLLKYAIQFMNGFAVPLNRLDEVLDKLDDIEARFNAVKISFLDDYNEAVNNWIIENPSCAEQIRKGLIPKETVSKRINFDYQVFKIGQMDDERGYQRLQNKVSAAGEGLISEVVSSALAFYTGNLAGKKQCDLKTKKTLENLRNKVDGLVFLNGNLTHIVDLLEQTIDVYDSCTGRFLNGPAFDKLVATILILSDENRLEDYCRGAVTNSNLLPQDKVQSEKHEDDSDLISKWFKTNVSKDHEENSSSKISSNINDDVDTNNYY